MTVSVKASRNYNVIIENSARHSVGTLCREVIGGNKALLLSDTNVAPLYGEDVKRSLENAGFEVFSYTVAAGEESKSTENYLAIVGYLAQQGFTRADTLVALGGGVVGDLGGFSAATYMRGIGFVQMPTSVLAAVDSSVGGKTAVNLAAGKNLLGAFYQPHLVVCDPETLETLPKEIYADGMAEVIKYGMIWDKDFFCDLEKGSLDITEIIKKCVEIKGAVVGEDELDKGLRQILNFGHTVGHAIEKCSHFGITHGSAVAMGMAIISRAVNKELCERLTALLEKTGLPTACPYTASELYNAALADKKRQAESLTIVTVPEIGKYELKRIKITELLGYIEAGL